MKLRYINILLMGVLLVSCGGGDSGGDPDPQPDPVAAPSAATLIFPDNNTECNEGDVVSDTQSRVTFQWNASQNTDSYEINIKNLNSNNTSKSNSNTNSADITIERGVPYEWFVVSKATGTAETASSATWKFYNQGPGIENYAPFPAEAVYPNRGASIDSSGPITLEWTASDVDNDLAEFDVYFGMEPDPVTLVETTAESTSEVTVASGETYYWRIISRDSQGNTSQSEIFEFLVE
ncbi:MAG: hypothetical protein KJN76_01035 [Eudoraea sp.]|nr:hypothetical protein [Eudoraea sp.]